MVEISLSNSELKALIDEDDLTLVSRYKWRLFKCSPTHAYPATKVNGRLVLLHRLLAATAEFPEVDHKNGNRLDCTRKNLRPCTHAQNMMNRKVRKDCSSGFKGVYQDWRSSLFVARITANKKRQVLGWFKTPEEASAAYKEAAIRLHGEFANF